MKSKDSQISKEFTAEIGEQPNSYGINVARKGTIMSIKQIAKRTTQVVIKVAEDFKFIAGQYIWLVIPELKYPDPKGNTRMFSIASSPNKTQEIEIVFRDSESGYKKTLVEMMPGKAEITFSGPYGSLELPKNNSLPVVLVAGGVGVAPFLSMIRFSSETSSGHKITLVYVNNNKNDVPYFDELSQLAKRNPNFTLANYFGLLDQSTLEKFTDDKIIWFVVGSREFVDSAGNILILQDVPIKNIFFEQFYPCVSVKSKFEQTLKSINPDVADYPYFLALGNTTNHIIITDVNGSILYANKGAETMTGYTFSEMRGNTPRLWGGLMSSDFYKDFWRTIKHDRQTFFGEVINRRKNQEEYYALIRVSPVIEKDGNLTGFIATEEDITDQKRIMKDLEDAKTAARNVLDDLQVEKEALAYANSKDEALLASIADGVIATDSDGKIILMNKAAQNMLGWGFAEVKEKSVFNMIQLVDGQRQHIPLEKRPLYFALAGTITTVPTYYYVHKDNTKFPVAIKASPILLGKEIIGAIEVFRDITRETEIDKAKSEFVSLASHQLRTPLGIIKWYIETLESEEYYKSAPKKIQELIAEIYKSNERVLSLVRNLLSVSRIDQGQVKNVLTSVNPVSVIKQVVKSLQTVAGKKKISLKLIIKAKTPSIKIDLLRLHEVIENLIVNAIEYSKQLDTVTICVNSVGDSLVMNVEDAGIGLSEADQKKLFTKFFRSENAYRHNPEGTGLGLYVVKSYVEDWGGTVSVTSKEGKGSTFTISLPMTNNKLKGGDKK